MKVINKKIFLLFGLGIIAPLTIYTPSLEAGTFGAEIFCTMRDGGNEHESSWEAAYSYIKKQKGGWFKVSPKDAAAQITEIVIRDKDKFSYCIEYLDDLHPNRKLLRDLEREEKIREKKAQERRNKRKKLERSNEDFSEDTIDRYSY